MSVKQWWANLFPRSTPPALEVRKPRLTTILWFCADWKPVKVFQEGDARTVLKVSLKFEPGEFVVLLGHSGSGKSTLLNLISGIDQPTEGTVRINGLAITELDERSRTLLRRDATLSSNSSTLFPHSPGMWPCRKELAGRSSQVAQQSALKLFRTGGVDRLNTFPDKLSGNSRLLLPALPMIPSWCSRMNPPATLTRKLDSGCCTAQLDSIRTKLWWWQPTTYRSLTRWSGPAGTGRTPDAGCSPGSLRRLLLEFFPHRAYRLHRPLWRLAWQRLKRDHCNISSAFFWGCDGHPLI